MLYLNNYEIISERFPNGELKVNYKQIDDIYIEALQARNNIMLLTFKYRTDADLIELLLVGSYVRELAKVIHLRIAYMPYSRMDRRGNGSYPFTLKYVSDMINSIGFNIIEIFEPHSDVCVALLDAEPTYFAPMARDYLYWRKLMNDGDYVMFPDGTAQKRYSEFFKNPQLLGYKHRDFDTGKITDYKVINPNQQLDYLSGDVSINYESKVYIVDDLIAKGTTVYNAALGIRKLFGNGVEPEINVIAAHVEDSIFDGKLLKEDSPINAIYTSSSILTKQHEKLKVIHNV